MSAPAIVKYLFVHDFLAPYWSRLAFYPAATGIFKDAGAVQPQCSSLKKLAVSTEIVEPDPKL